jgi:hypothetical protein
MEVGDSVDFARACSEKASGASFIVTGNFFEKNGNSGKLREFANAVHFKQPIPTMV